MESEYEVAEKARLRKQAAREQGNGALNASAGLAERLLQGWAMLSKACPEAGCYSPLMRDRNGAEVCVSCSSSTVAEKGVGARAVPSQAAGDLMGEVHLEDEGEEEDKAMLDGAAGHIYTELRVAELTKSAAAVGVTKEEAAGSIDYLRVKTETLDALYTALDLSKQRLRACSPVSMGVDESMRQVDLITKLAVATRAVFDMPT